MLLGNAGGGRQGEFRERVHLAQARRSEIPRIVGDDGDEVVRSRRATRDHGPALARQIDVGVGGDAVVAVDGVGEKQIEVVAVGAGQENVQIA